MDLLSIFKRPAAVPPAAAAGEPADAVQRARTRARQRLIGAAVLLAIGVIGFPLVFETQPRPIPVDIPIEVPRKDGAPPLVMPPARAPAPPAGNVAADPRPAAPNDVITESREDAGRDVTAKPGAGALPAKPTATAKPAEAVVPAASKPAATARPAVAGGDASRAQALLEGKPAAAATAEATRYVVQVGAFADAAAAREARAKVEKLGLKTYTQVASTPAGNRIRVRVGPFASREEADKAHAKARGAGLAAAVLTL